ncbi:Vps16B, partial [Operophtera brumata]
MEDEDYWNTSETKAKAFSFDDDVKPYAGQTEQDMFGAMGITVKTTLLPITILLAQSGKDVKKESRPETAETVPVTLKRLVLGRSCSLHVHRSLKSKTELLDGAISPLQYDWVVLNVHAKSNKWDIVESLFTKKTLLARLNELNASKRMLATCVNKVA